MSKSYKVRGKEAMEERRNPLIQAESVKSKKAVAKPTLWRLEYDRRYCDQGYRSDDRGWRQWNNYASEAQVRQALAQMSHKYNFYEWRILDPNWIVLEIRYSKYAYHRWAQEVA